jgi:hypothetical protein
VLLEVRLPPMSTWFSAARTSMHPHKLIDLLVLAGGISTSCTVLGYSASYGRLNKVHLPANCAGRYAMTSSHPHYFQLGTGVESSMPSWHILFLLVDSALSPDRPVRAN